MTPDEIRFIGAAWKLGLDRAAELLRVMGAAMEADPSDDDGEPPRRFIMIADIQREVAMHFGIPLSEMRSARRARVFARPRQVAMYLATELTLHSLPEIGRRFGWRDHTTVIHAKKETAKRRRADPVLDRDIRDITDRLNAGAIIHLPASHDATAGGESGHAAAAPGIARASTGVGRGHADARILLPTAPNAGTTLERI